MDGTKPKGGMTGEDAYAVVLHRKSRKKLPHFEADEELSLVPYLDVMMNLVIFMLVTIATLMPLGILNIFPPQIREAEAADDSTKQEESINFTVAISADQGYILASTKGPMPPIGKKPDGNWDFDGLTRKAAEIKKDNPKEVTVSIVADRQVRYEVLIRSMDALRTIEGKELFPDVKLGKAE